LRPYRRAGGGQGDRRGSDSDHAGVGASLGEILLSRQALARRRRGAAKLARRSAMETRANYVLMGLFTLAVIIGAFGFVYWFNTIGGAGDRAIYRIVFEGSVSGLRPGASVLFNGIRVGEVTELKLDPSAP